MKKALKSTCGRCLHFDNTAHKTDSRTAEMGVCRLENCVKFKNYASCKAFASAMTLPPVHEVFPDAVAPPHLAKPEQLELFQ